VEPLLLEYKVIKSFVLNYYFAKKA
jgi:hypothetical protein